MAFILSIRTETPPYYYSQEETKAFVSSLFRSTYKKIDRLLSVFQNGDIQGRYFSAPLEWFEDRRSFSEKNQRYIELATNLGTKAIEETLKNQHFLKKQIDYKEIDAIFFISSTGISTPSIEAKIMNKLPFRENTKRIPIWGLGCAGGAAGLARAYEYCKAFPKANVLVLCVELCSLTFQKDDVTKSNIIGTSLFADGVSCCLVSGKESALLQYSQLETIPKIMESQSTFMSHSEDVMGWDVQDSGLHVIFSKDIPSIIKKWLKPNIEKFLNEHHLKMNDVSQIIAHPGGKKVLQAYEIALNLTADHFYYPRKILRHYGNMSSATVLFVLTEILKLKIKPNEFGILFALGPGFSSECVLLQWQHV